MSTLGRRFTLLFLVLSGILSGLIVLLYLGRWLFPGSLGGFPAWLPEDLVAGLGYQFVADVLVWYPALALSALLLACSYWLRPEELPPGETAPLVRFAVMAIGTTVVFAILTLLVQPWFNARLEELQFRQNQTKQLEDAYLAIDSRGTETQTAADLEARLSLLKRLGQLRPMQTLVAGKERLDYDFELQILKAHFDLDEFFRLRSLEGVRAMGSDSSASVEELLTQAEQLLKTATSDGEYQANHAGMLAYRRLGNALDQGKRIDAKLLERAKTVVDESWGRIYEKTLKADERLKASYFFRKGKSLGDFQFQNYLEAYYGFRELHLENPRDQEVSRYSELSRQKIEGQVLFWQEMEVLFAVPASENLVFVNRTTPVEIIRIGKLLNTSQGVFLKDFELLRMDQRGQVLLHWRAPFGRWGEQGIDFRVWDKEKPTPRFPEVLLETPGDEYNPEATVDPPRFLPAVGVRDLEAVNRDQPQPQTLGTLDLLVHGRAIEALGYNSRLFQTEFLVRLGSPFGFFLAFLVVFALAWRNRAHDPGRTWWFLVPILPLIAEFVVQTTEWVCRLAVGGVLAGTGLETTIIVLTILFLGGSIMGVFLVQHQFQKHRA